MKAVIFDRDGTLMRFRNYPKSVLDVVLMPGAERLWELDAKGVHLYLHSNQSGPARGLMTEKEMHRVQNEFMRQLGGNPFKRICLATEPPDTVDGYRKPSPRFIREILKDTGLPPSSVVMIGDAECDAIAASAAGVQCILLASPRVGNYPPGTIVVDNLNQAINLL